MQHRPSSLFRSPQLSSAALTLCLCALAFALRPTALTVPRFYLSDSGVFYAVFHRIAQGERLYADVFDHKDPLFYLFYTAGYALLGDAGPMVWETALTLVSLGLAVLICRQLRLGFSSTALVALGFFAFFLHPYSYLPVHTNHQAIALALGAAALGLARRDLLAGVLLGAMVLTKLTYALFIPSLALLALASAERPFVQPSLARLARIAAGGLLAAAAGLLALLLSGSLWAYLDVIRLNVRYQAEYAQIRALYWPYTPGSPLDVLAADLSPALLAAHLALLLAGVAGALWPAGRAADAPGRGRMLALALGAALAIGAAAYLLASSYAWPHYYQAVALPTLLAAIAGVAPHQRRLARPKLALPLLALYGLLAVASGALSPVPSYLELRRPQRAAEADERQLRPCIVEQAEAAGARTFATLGSNDPVQAARLVPPGLRLQCRSFYQFPWFHGAILEELAECLETQRPDLVFQRAWHFPLDVEARLSEVLARDYQRHTGCGQLVVWRRR